MQRFIIAMSVFAFACGGEMGLDEGDDDGSMSSLAQPFRGKNTPNFQFGTQTGAGHQRCNKTATGQACAIPPSKTLTYCLHGVNISGSGPAVFSNTSEGRARAIIEGLDAISDFTLNEMGFTDCVSGPGQMNFYPVSVGSAGTASSDIKDYADVQFNGLTGLSEGVGVVGNYSAWTSCTAKIDATDIAAKGTSSTQDNNGLDQGVAHTLLECLGLGGRTTMSATPTRNLFNPAQAAVSLSTGEGCQLLEFTLSDPGSFNLKTPQCTSD